MAPAAAPSHSMCSCHRGSCIEAASSEDFSWPILTAAFSVLCCALAFWAGTLSNGQGRKLLFFRSRDKKSVGKGCGSAEIVSLKACNGNYAGSVAARSPVVLGLPVSECFPYNSGISGEKLDKQQNSISPCNVLSMMEQLVPEITQHVLSYLDYRSLCRMSMTNRAMKKAADDDSVWKALYNKDFTSEQNSLLPINGWKAYYAVTRAVLEINAAFYRKFRSKSLKGMSRLWLHADYVKCIHPGGELISGYDAVMENWRSVFSWSHRYDFQIQGMRVRVHGDMAWVTNKAYVNASIEPLLSTNCYEFHDGKWYIVHYHCSPQLEFAAPDYGMFG